MAKIQLNCPHCRAVLSFSQEVPRGAVVSCSICSGSFSVPERTPAATTAAAAVKPATARPAVAPRRPAPIRSATRAVDATQSSRVGTILGGVVLGGVLLLLLGGLSYLFWKSAFADRPAATDPPTKDGALAKGPLAEPGGPQAKGDSQGSRPKKDSPPPSDGDGGEDIADNRPKKVDPSPSPSQPEAIKPKDTDPPQKGPPPIEITVPSPAGPPPVAGVDPARVNEAVAKGVRYLKDRQNADGSWEYPANQVGVTALAGLSLIEAGSAANDPAVQKAAQWVRQKAAQTSRTYDIATSILFLDRVNDPKDRVLIQGLGMRLLLGQNNSGGWSYECPLFGLADLRSLFAFLQSHRPVAASPRKAGQVQRDITDDPLGPEAGWLQAKPGVPIVVGVSGELTPPLPPPRQGAAKPAGGPFRPDGQAAPDEPVDPKGKKRITMPLAGLPEQLRQLPAVQLSMNKGWMTATKGGGDNSNTQFAILALWAARRHDVPSEYSLLLSFQRFQRCQADDGGWSYCIGEPTTETMTCAGLLGVAMGYGTLPNAGGKQQLEQASIQAGLGVVARRIGSPQKEVDPKAAMPNLYFLWSVERVGVLYELTTIGGKNWYGWGAQLLLAKQRDDGSWTSGGYTGAVPPIDTCFALLFLKRSNLVPDLTENLRLQMVIRDKSPP
jgi:hypothetical protein